MSFLPPPSMRHIMAVPRQDKVDFRAACFCHKNIVDIGFVCSVCLSSEFRRTSVPGPVVEHHLLVFCTPVPVCSTCRFVVCRNRRVVDTSFRQDTIPHENPPAPQRLTTLYTSCERRLKWFPPTTERSAQPGYVRESAISHAILLRHEIG